MPTFPVIAQAAGVLAVLAGLFLLLPLGAAVLIGGALVAVVGVALEIGQARSSSPSDARSGTNDKGAV
jgi:hypothetical protein